MEEAAASVFAGSDFVFGSAFDSTLDFAGASDTASLTTEDASEAVSETASLSDASSDADSDETGFDSTGEADSDTDSATEAVLVSAFAPQPDARSITPQRITPIIL